MRHERLTPKQWASERLERLEELSIGKVIPSALTLLGLCAGATAIRFALEQEWKLAVIAIFSAMMFDMLDGRAARWLGADSRFGAQLDSLADLVSFGVAPAVLTFTWSLWQMGDAGWVAALIFCVCSAIRLARFNIQAARDEGATQSHPYFTGLPTPAAACVMMLPLLLNFDTAKELFRHPLFGMVLIGITSTLMVSHVPTPSLKFIRMDDPLSRIAVAVMAVAFVPCAVYVPWTTLITGMTVYVCSIPFFIHKQHAERNTEYRTQGSE
jgi:CDP-diacylglycerol--serine O-phosphatidyltransferase